MNYSNVKNVNPSNNNDGNELWWRDISANLGAVYPFQDTKSPSTVSLNIGHIIEAKRHRGEPVELDPIGLAEKSINPYLLGNRTLLKDVIRSPWMAKLSKDGKWLSEFLPQHGYNHPSNPEKFIIQLKKALVEEAQYYTQGAKTVGILLSGGMDSRVVAGVVREVQRIWGNQFKVVGLTWGEKKSRDVVYAKKITELFGWEWRHYSLTADTLANNIQHMGAMGAEVSPLHLHAIPEIAKSPNLDVVLAGSYGDSVGQGKFSGKNLTELTPLLPKQKNQFNILRRSLLSVVTEELKTDLTNTPHLSEQTSTLRHYEIEQQCHYMRRMLQCCMNEIACHKRFYQMFTSPAVFRLMWNLDPRVRDNRWYIYLLRELPGKLLEIPWSRTGKRYDRPEGTADQLPQNFHKYGIWLRNELKEEIINRVNSKKIRGLGVFNNRSLDYCLNAWTHSKTISINSLDELFSWIASLHDFLDIYQIDTKEPIAIESHLDKISALKGGTLAKALVVTRNHLRN